MKNYLNFFTSLFTSNNDETERQENIVRDFEEKELIDTRKSLAEMEKREKLITEYFQLLDRDKYEEALESINFAINSMPDESAFYEQKSFCLRQMQRFDEAIEVLDKAIEQFPEEKASLEEIKTEILADIAENHPKTI